MNTKHTPAPWITDTENQFIFSEGKSETEPNIICRFFGMTEENYPNSEANAKLIAAAPELLEALKELVLVAKTFEILPCKWIDPLIKAENLLNKVNN